jgi:hypothetical protein
MNTNMNKDRLRELEDLLTDEHGYLDVEVVSLVKHFVEQEVAEARREQIDRLLVALEEMIIRKNERNVLMYGVEIDNYNMAIDDVIKYVAELQEEKD